jgi:hypothetical protein
MTKWKIENASTGVVLGVYEGATANDALDLMAQDAGYEDYQDMKNETGSSMLYVTEVEE